MPFDELNENSRIEDPEERAAGQIVKSKKKNFFAKKTKTSSMSFSTYKFIKNIITFALTSALIIGIFYVFYLGIKLFVSE